MKRSKQSSVSGKAIGAIVRGTTEHALKVSGARIDRLIVFCRVGSRSHRREWTNTMKRLDLQSELIQTSAETLEGGAPTWCAYDVIGIAPVLVELINMVDNGELACVIEYTQALNVRVPWAGTGNGAEKIKTRSPWYARQAPDKISETQLESLRDAKSVKIHDTLHAPVKTERTKTYLKLPTVSREYAERALAYGSTIVDYQI